MISTDAAMFDARSDKQQRVLACCDNEKEDHSFGRRGQIEDIS